MGVRYDIHENDIDWSRVSMPGEVSVMITVVHMSSLVKGTWFVRPLTIDHLSREWGSHKDAES